MMKDLLLISGDFLDYPIPKAKQFLLKYYKTDRRRAFLKYFLVFRNSDRFIQHTGWLVKKRYKQVLRENLIYLENEMEEARASSNLEKIALLESGQFRLERFAARRKKGV